MSTIKRQLQESDLSLFDRLVDGELNDRQRKELLGSLDDEPGGWRRCALAFLEAQAWRDDLRGFRPAEETVPAEENVPAIVPVVSGRRGAMPHAKIWEIALAVAASALVAFAVGSRWTPGRGAVSGSQFATVTAPSLSTGVRSADRQLVAHPATGRPRAWSVLRLPIAVDEGQMTEVTVPVLEGADLATVSLNEAASAIPSEVRQAWERTGHQVDRTQRLWPIQLDDGRQAVVPVEQVNVRYVGTRKFQ